MSADFNENVIEFLEDDKYALVTFSQKRYINKIRSLAKKFPDKCKIEDESSDHIYARIPTSWVRIQGTVEKTQQQKNMLREAAKDMLSQRSTRG